MHLHYLQQPRFPLGDQPDQPNFTRPVNNAIDARTALVDCGVLRQIGKAVDHTYVLDKGRHIPNPLGLLLPLVSLLLPLGGRLALDPPLHHRQIEHPALFFLDHRVLDKKYTTKR